MSIFEKDFDIKSYIEDKLLEISSLENRRDYRDMMLRVFYHMYEDIEEKYTVLEDRVMSEVPIVEVTPEVITTVVQKSRHNASNDFLYPLKEDDLYDYVPDKAAMMKLISEGKGYFIKKIFIKADAKKIIYLANKQPLLNGLVITKHGQFAGKFKLIFDDYYLKKVHELYDISHINIMQWRTLFTPYLYKMFKIELVELSGFDAQDEITSIMIDYGDLKEAVMENPLPVWNVTNVSFKTGAYPDPCIDHINYEHVIFEHNFNKKCQYMIVGNNENTAVNNVRLINGDMIISSNSPEPVTWNMLEFHYEKEMFELGYDNPLQSNGQIKTLGNELRNYYGQRVRSLTELRRIIASCTTKGPKLAGTKIIKNVDIYDCDTYSPDDFIEDGIRRGNWEYALQLDFKAESDNYLNYDIISYYTGIVQEYFSDFRCYGRLLR